MRLFLVVLAIKPIFSGKCSASRSHFCSFHYYNKPIFIHPNKYIFLEEEIFFLSLRNQVSGKLHILTDSSEEQLQLCSCKQSHSTAWVPTSVSYKTTLLQGLAGSSASTFWNRSLLHYWSAHWWWRPFMTLRLLPACSGTVDHESGSICSLKKPQT